MVGRVIANSSLGLPSPCGVVPQVPILVKRTITTDEKIMSREVVVEKTTNGKESLKITIKAPTLRGGRPKPRLQRIRHGNPKLHNWLDQFTLPVRPV
jgi:hypothetical protein